MGSTDIKIIQKGILGHLGHSFSTYAGIEKNCINNICKESKKGVPSVPSIEIEDVSGKPIDAEPFADSLEPNDPELIGILKMPLSQFKRGGYLIRVRCRHLGGEEVFIASSEREAAIGRAEGLTCYLPDELHNLIKAKATPEEVMAVHQVKQTFEAKLQEVREIKPVVRKKGVSGYGK